MFGPRADGRDHERRCFFPGFSMYAPGPLPGGYLPITPSLLHVCALFRVRRLYRPCVLTPLSHRTLSAAPAAVASRGRSRASKAAFTAGHCRGAGRCVIHQDHHKAAASVVGVTLHAPP